jgi:hypothetical protein
MITPDRSRRLQQVADYRTVRKTLRASGIGSIVFGSLALVGGVAAPFDPILTGLGLVLLGTGLWNTFAPRPTGILVDGITLLLVGLYNIGGAALSAGHGAAGPSLWVKLGIFQLIWGGQAFMRFRRFRDAFQDPPGDVELTQLDGEVSALWKANSKQATDVIEFTTAGLMHAAKWKGRLDDGFALLATANGAEVRIVMKEAFEIEDRGKGLIGSSHRVALKLAGKNRSGAMGLASLERYQQWKTGVVIPKPIAA